MPNQNTGTFESFDDITDPNLKKIATRAYNALRIAAHRVAAHHEDSKAFPLPADPKSLEAVLLARFKKLQSARQTSVAAKSVRALRAPEAKRKRAYGDMSRLDVSKPITVEKLAASIALPSDLKISTANLNSMRAAPDAAPSPPPAPPGGKKNDKLELRVRYVRCLEETSEIGDDEIKLGGTTIDETGDTELIKPFMVWNEFDTGDRVNFDPPRRFASFSLNEGGNDWPKTYYVTLAMAEEDEGGFASFLKDLLDGVKGMVVPLIASAAGAAVGSVIPGIGTAIGAIAGAVLGFFIDWIVGWWKDDMFTPVTVSATIKSYDHHFASGSSISSEKWIGWKQHGGHYRVFFDWRVYA